MINFEASLKSLDDGNVTFVVIGGFAAVIHGSAAVTRDLDICYERTPDNMKRLADALAPHHPRLRGAPAGLPFLFDQQTIAQGMNFTLETGLGDIDLLGEVSGLGQYPEVSRDAVRVQLYGGHYRVVSLDALIVSKRAAGRGKDLNVLPELEALQELRTAQKEDKDKKR